MLNQLTSITSISRVIPTAGSLPVVVLANDFEEYACKYDSGSKLINDYLGHQFLQHWGLQTLPAALVQIQKEHIPKEILGGRIQMHLFDKPSFGLRYNNDAASISDVLLGLRGDHYEVSKFTDRYDLMNIGLFDLWLANNDRNENNSNLLIIDSKFIAIDHADIFDGCGLGRPLSQLTNEDSILNSSLAATFLSNKTKRENRCKELIVQFPNFVSNCKKALPELINHIPDEWCSDKAYLTDNIMSSVIDNPTWIRETISSFSELIHNFNH
ncbi:MAG: hypothetical protein MUP99_01260 [Pedobacter sp.]|nr:hypothetical protein [Pedobacter sp.]